MVALSLLVWSTTARAVDVIILPVANDAVNLSAVGERHESKDPNLQIKVFGAKASDHEELTVSALSKRAPYRWLTFALVNSTNSIIKPLIVVPQRGFAGTGLIWPIIGGKTVLSITASSGSKPEPVFGRPGIYRLSVEPKQTVTYVVEIAGNWPPRLGLWNERVYEFHIQNRALFRGLLLGVAGLISLYLSVLYFVSRQATYLSAALFSIASTALLLSEFGYFTQGTFDTPDLAIKIRSAIEALMALGVVSFMHTFLFLRYRLPFFGYLVLIVLFCLAGLVAYAFYQPYYTAGLARMGFGGGVGFGSLIILYLTARGNPRAQAVLPAWITLVCWTLFVGSAIDGAIAHPLLSPGIASGLVLVLLLIAFVVTQFALGRKMSGESTGRQTLALAGAGHSVWDYDLEQKTFYVSPEIENLLGLRPGHFQLGGVHTWLDLMHQDDRANYNNKIEATVRDGMGRLNLSFRMRGSDGKYRWLQLRARAMTGENKLASRCIGILADITHAKLSEERLLRDAVHDYLTGLPNHALFLDRLERATNRYVEEDDYGIGLILVDIDRFNNINDSLGHTAGDSFLLISARRISEHISTSDTVARVAENRFAILITSQTDAGEIRKIAEKIQDSISQPIPFKPEAVYLTTNIGMAIFKSDKDDAAEFMKKAEIAMYSAKRRGRNNLSVFDPRMARRTTNRVTLESDMRRAIEKNEFKLMYQPIVRLETGKIAGFEALVRWQHKDRGLLDPGEFMDIAEETDLIIDIGRFVLNEAGMQLGSWQRLFTFEEPLFMSVNVSTRQINQPDLIDDLQSILDRAEIEPGTLKIEVTETQVMENPEMASRVLHRIRKIGAGLSLDDFGTGYSSLSYLQSFPFDVIKVDKSFVHSENDDPTNNIILKSVISLAHDLGMQVVAEGAEEVEEAVLLNELGCEFVQGFLFGEPMNARDAQKLLSQKPMSADSSAAVSIFEKIANFKLASKLLPLPKEDDFPVVDTEQTQLDMPPEIIPEEAAIMDEPPTKEEISGEDVGDEEKVIEEASSHVALEDAPEKASAVEMLPKPPEDAHLDDTEEKISQGEEKSEAPGDIEPEIDSSTADAPEVDDKKSQEDTDIAKSDDGEISADVAVQQEQAEKPEPVETKDKTDDAPETSEEKTDEPVEEAKVDDAKDEPVEEAKKAAKPEIEKTEPKPEPEPKPELEVKSEPATKKERPQAKLEKPEQAVVPEKEETTEASPDKPEVVDKADEETKPAAKPSPQQKSTTEKSVKATPVSTRKNKPKPRKRPGRRKKRPQRKPVKKKT